MADSFLSLPGSSGIISAGASVLGNLFNWFQTESARDYEREMQDRQWRYAREQWERENAYNMPSAQMARLRAAGINPHLAFANGDVMNQAASSPTVPDAKQVQPYTVNPLEASAIALQAAEADKASAEAEALRGYKKDESMKIIDQMNQSIEESKKRVDLMDAEEKKALAEKAAIEFKSWLDGYMSTYQVKQLKAEIGKLLADADVSKSQEKLNDRTLHELIATFATRLANMKLEGALTQQQINEYTAMWRQIGVQFDDSGKATIIPDSPLDKQLSKYGRHTAIYSYLEDVFGLIGTVFGAGANVGVSIKPGKKS